MAENIENTTSESQSESSSQSKPVEKYMSKDNMVYFLKELVKRINSSN